MNSIFEMLYNLLLHYFLSPVQWQSNFFLSKLFITKKTLQGNKQTKINISAHVFNMSRYGISKIHLAIQ